LLFNIIGLYIILYIDINLEEKSINIEDNNLWTEKY